MIGARGHKLFLAFTWLSLTLVIAVFLELAAQTLLLTPLSLSQRPCIFFCDGFWCRYLSLWYIFKSHTIIMLPILFGSLIFGIESSWVQSTFALSLDTWRMALIVYIFALQYCLFGCFCSLAIIWPRICYIFPCLSAVWA